MSVVLEGWGGASLEGAWEDGETFAYPVRAGHRGGLFTRCCGSLMLHKVFVPVFFQTLCER